MPANLIHDSTSNFSDISIKKIIMTRLSYQFAKNLLLLHEGLSIITQVKAAVKIALGLSIPAWALASLSEWTITNRDFIGCVLLCIAIDHLIGSWYHAFKKQDFSFKKNATGLLSKIGLCAAAAVLFEIIHYTVRDVSVVYDYLKYTTRLIILLYPAGSAFLNMSALTNGAFPPIGWIKRITAYNNSLDLNKIYRNGSTDIAEDTITAPGDPSGGAGSL